MVALEADEPVRIVLEHCELVLPGDLDDAGRAGLSRAFFRSGSGTWGSCRGTTAARCGSRSSASSASGSRPSSSIGDGDDLGSLAGEDLQWAVVARRLDENATWSSRELLGRVEDEALETSDREDDPPGAHAVALCDPLP